MIAVSSFGKDSIGECLRHLRENNNEELKVIVDNGGQSKNYIESIIKMIGLNNAVVVENEGNWEWSAWWKAYNSFPNEDRYLFIHDSMFLKKNSEHIYQYVVDDDDVFIFDTRLNGGWWSSKYDIRNSNTTKQFGKIFSVDRNDFNLVFGSMFACRKKTMQDLQNAGIMSIHANDRCDAEACERLLGIAFDELKKNVIIYPDRKTILPPKPGGRRVTSTNLFDKVRSGRSS